MAPAIQFEESTHTYRVAGKVLPSVTQILSSLGMTPIYPDVEFYKARGRAVHLATALADQGKLARVDDRLLGYVAGWKAFLRDSGAKVELVEHRVASTTFGYCGTLDRLLWLSGVPTIADLKSGEIPAYAALQTSGYRRALMETDGIHAERRMAVRLFEDGRYGVKEYADHAGDDRMFLAATAVFRWIEMNV